MSWSINLPINGTSLSALLIPNPINLKEPTIAPFIAFARIGIASNLFKKFSFIALPRFTTASLGLLNAFLTPSKASVDSLWATPIKPCRISFKGLKIFEKASAPRWVEPKAASKEPSNTTIAPIPVAIKAILKRFNALELPFVLAAIPFWAVANFAIAPFICPKLPIKVWIWLPNPPSKGKTSCVATP